MLLLTVVVCSYIQENRDNVYTSHIVTIPPSITSCAIENWMDFGTRCTDFSLSVVLVYSIGMFMKLSIHLPLQGMFA